MSGEGIIEQTGRCRCLPLRHLRRRWSRSRFPRSPPARTSTSSPRFMTPTGRPHHLRQPGSGPQRHACPPVCRRANTPSGSMGPASGRSRLATATPTTDRSASPHDHRHHQRSRRTGPVHHRRKTRRPAASVGTPLPRNDHGASPLTYQISSGNTNSAFAMDPATGLITVANPAALDFEALRAAWDCPGRHRA